MNALFSGSIRVLAMHCMLLTLSATAEEMGTHPEQISPLPSFKLWSISTVVLSGAIGADAISSIRLNGNPNLRETNSLLASSSGQFESRRAVAIQAGLAAAVLIPEYLLIRKYPKIAKPLSYVNFGLTAIPAHAAIHNFGLH
jgi:hypothetical protein